MSLASPYDVKDANRNKLVRPLQEEVRKQKLWACHLEPELGGQGYGQVKLALMNEILGRSRFAPTVFGCQAPDTGNSEILAKYGTEEQKKQFLEPLLRNEIVSCFSMTEPQGGADPKVFATKAELKGDNWVINGEKWFSSNANYSSFLIVMAVTDPDASQYNRLSTFIVPTNTDGLNIVRSVGVGQELEGTHGYVRYQDVTVPKDHLLGPRGRRVCGRADAARRRTNPSCDAHDRAGAQGVRPDVRARALAHDAGIAAGRQADGAGACWRRRCCGSRESPGSAVFSGGVSVRTFCWGRANA